MAKVQDLIAKCEETEIFTQNLDENITAMEIKDGNGFITFVTNPKFVQQRILSNSEKTQIGIVVWFPADVFKR